MIDEPAATIQGSRIVSIARTLSPIETHYSVEREICVIDNASLPFSTFDLATYLAAV